MEEAIKNFGKQFDYIPEVVNKENLSTMKHIILLGMGGSHLAGDIAKNLNQTMDIWIHRDYGLPEVSDEFLKNSLIIASSYSGNTEEVIDGLETALKADLKCAVMTVGGKLLEMAKEQNLPYIALPDTGIQPRLALGYSLVALAHLLNFENLLKEIEAIKGKLNPEEHIEEGTRLASSIKGLVPVVYTSRRNFAVAYNWKIKLNETGKTPAFFNVFPEINHNEMTGFDLNEKTKDLGLQFVAIILSDTTDHPQIQKRMKIVKKLYEDRSIKVINIPLTGETSGEKIFNSLLLADWTAYHIATLNGAETEQVPMVEEFKRLIT